MAEWGLCYAFYMVHLPGRNRGQVSSTFPQLLLSKICQMHQIMANERRSALGLRVPKPVCCLTVAHSVIIAGLGCFQRVTYKKLWTVWASLALEDRLLARGLYLFALVFQIEVYQNFLTSLTLTVFLSLWPERGNEAEETCPWLTLQARHLEAYWKRS